MDDKEIAEWNENPAGETLGKKHRQYNNKVKEIIARKENYMKKINYEDIDLDNFVKIDVANHFQNVEFILDVLKCEDIVFISRAIKNCKWLIIDDQYSNIIGPEYLETHLYPEMMPKARKKFVPHIRKYLRNETRVDVFFRYYEIKDIRAAVKWLAFCSLSLAEEAVSKYGGIIPLHVLRFLFQRSIHLYSTFVTRFADKALPAATTAYIVNKYPEEYLNITKSYPKFSKRSSKALLRNCQETIIENFEIYANSLRVDILAKHLDVIQTKQILEGHCENDNIEQIYQYPSLKHFMFKFPVEARSKYIKEIILNKPASEIEAEYMLSPSLSKVVKFDIQWYRFIPFDDALNEATKFILSDELTKEVINSIKCLIEELVHDKKKLGGIDEQTWEKLNDFFKAIGVYNETYTNNIDTCIQLAMIYNLINDKTVPEIIENKFEFNSLNSFKLLLNTTEQETVFKYLFNYLLSKEQPSQLENESQAKETIMLLENVLKLLRDWEKDLILYPDVLKKLKHLIQLLRDNPWKINDSKLFDIKKSWRKYMFEDSLVLKPSEDVLINALKHDPSIYLRRHNDVEAIFCNNDIQTSRTLNKIRIYWPHTLAKAWTQFYKEKIATTSDKAIFHGLLSLTTYRDAVALLNEYIPDQDIFFDKHKIEVSRKIGKYMHLVRPQMFSNIMIAYAKHHKHDSYPAFMALFYNFKSQTFYTHYKQFENLPESMQKYIIRVAYPKLSVKDLSIVFNYLWRCVSTNVREFLFIQTLKLVNHEKDPSVVAELQNLILDFINELPLEGGLYSTYELVCQVSSIPHSMRAKYVVNCYKKLSNVVVQIERLEFVGKLMQSAAENLKESGLNLECMEEILIEPLITKLWELVLILKNKDLSFTRKMSVVDILANIEAISIYERPLYLSITYKPTRLHNETISASENLTLTKSDEILIETVNDRLSSYMSLYTCFLPLSRTYIFNAPEEETQLIRFRKIYIPLLDVFYTITNGTKSGPQAYYQLKMALQGFYEDLVTTVIPKQKCVPVILFENLLFLLESRFPQNENYIIVTVFRLVVEMVKLLDKIDFKSKNLVEKGSNVANKRGPCWIEIYLELAPEFGKICVEHLNAGINDFSPAIWRLFPNVLKILFNVFDFPKLVRYAIFKEMLKADESVECYLSVIEAMKYNDWNEVAKWLELISILMSHKSIEVNMACYSKFKQYTKISISSK